MNSQISNPEFQLLLKVARSENDLDDFISKHQINWDYLLELSAKQRMLPLLHIGLKDIKGDKIPSTVLDYLKDFYFQNTQHNLLLVSRLVQLIQLLHEAGMESVPLKGMLLSKELYDSYAIRQGGDIDILIRPEDVALFVEILKEHGYQLMYPYSMNQLIALSIISREKDIKMIEPKGNIIVEIHWRVSSHELIRRSEAESIWQNLEETTLQDVGTKIFNQESMLMFLCFHAFNHQWNWVFHLWEIDQYVRKHPDLDWDWILNHVHNFGGINVLLLSLMVVNQLLGTQIPQIIQVQISSNQQVRTLFNQITIEPVRFEVKAESSINFLRLKDRLTLKKNIMGRVHQLIRYAIAPHHSDIIAFDLPPALHFLYFLISPFRLLFKTIRQIVARHK